MAIYRHPDNPPYGAIPENNHKRIVNIARDVLLSEPTADIADIKETIKERCVARRLAYNSDVIGKALDAATRWHR